MAAEGPLETKELLLVRYRSADRDRFLKHVLDPVVMARVDGPENESAADALFDRISSDSYPEHRRSWAVHLKATRSYIGHAWITNSPDLPEIGFVLSTPYWGRGLGTQAAAAVLEHGHAVLSLPRIAATVDLDHTRSRRVLEKIGMELERVVEDPSEPYAVYWSVRRGAAC